MPLLPQLADPQPLIGCLHAIENRSLHGTWLFCAQDVSHVTPDLLCHPQVISSDQMSEEEADAFERAVSDVGLQPFLSVEQVEDVVSNLRSQHPAFKERDLIAALDYYWKHDAFSTPGEDAA